jgi:hypothetical protein
VVFSLSLVFVVVVAFSFKFPITITYTNFGKGLCSVLFIFKYYWRISCCLVDCYQRSLSKLTAHNQNLEIVTEIDHFQKKMASTKSNHSPSNKKKGPPKPPPKRELPKKQPRNLVEQIFDAFVGRGIRPVSLWVALVFVPGLLCLYFTSTTNHLNLFVLGFVGVCGWTVPLEKVARFIIALGNIRESLADVAPLIPGVLPYIPRMAKVIVPNAVKLAPAAGDLAPHLKYLLKYPEFAANALPLLVPKFDVMMEYNMIELLGPSLPFMDMRHYSKLEIILPDMMAKIDTLAPYFHIIAPHIVEISLRADRLFPYIEYMLPHAEAMKEHIWWLIPFADIDGFEEFMPHLDALAPFIDDFAPYGLELLPYVAKIRKHIPILIQNAETLVPQL